ncbi:MAG: aminotransferase class V-fold PLP-dependent enzyme [Gemmatimonadetes bacterium]|nr:aminotransferase class V-fold PLP-dependent enzyme [Gemmatimonadota bacterium]
MSVSRREFMGIVSTAALAGVAGAACDNEASQTPVDATAQVLSGDDPLGVRADFPVASESLYLNTPYIGPSPQPAVDKTIEFLAAKSRDPVLLGDMLEEEEAVREKFARLIRAQIGEIGLVSSTSEGENIVVNSLGLKAGDNVVIDDLHYMTSLVMYSQLAETLGIETRIVRNVDGVASPEAFADMVDENTKLVSVAWISNRNGYRHDLKALADVAHASGAYLYADAVQGVGMLDLDVGPTGVDFLTTGSYKWLLGGFGVAPFYVRESVMDVVKPDRLGWRMVDERLPDYQYTIYKDARKFGYATPAFAAIYQLSGSLEYLLNVGTDQIEQHTVALAHRLHAGLTEQGFEVFTPPGNQSAIVSFNHGADHEIISGQLAESGVRLSFRESNAQIRVGPALFNNEQDIDAFLDITKGWREAAS